MKGRIDEALFILKINNWNIKVLIIIEYRHI